MLEWYSMLEGEGEGGEGDSEEAACESQEEAAKTVAGHDSPRRSAVGKCVCRPRSSGWGQGNASPTDKRANRQGRHCTGLNIDFWDFQD